MSSAIPLGVPSQEQFFELARVRGLHVPEVRNARLLMGALIVTRGPKTIQALADSMTDGPTRSSLSRFMDGKWDSEECLLEPGRQWLLGQMNGPVCYHIIDDTANPRTPARRKGAWQDAGPRAMEGVDLHFDHCENRCVWGHSVVTSHVACGSWSAPWRQEIYRREEDCLRSGVPFLSKVDIACAMIGDFQAPAGAGEVVHLADSWYVNSKLIVVVRERGHKMVGGIKHNANIIIGGQKVPVLSAVKQAPVEIVTIGKHVYECARVEGTVFGQPGMAVVAAREKGCSGWKLIASTDASMTTARILEHYCVRWQIETGHWYLKCSLGMGDSRVRSLNAIRHFHALVVFTYWYLEWLRHERGLPTLADAQRAYIKSWERARIRELWRLARGCRTEEEAILLCQGAA